MAAEMPDEYAPRLRLTVTGGDGDADRTGYWMATGPQDPKDAYAIIERSRTPGPDGYVFYAWYLNRRSVPEYNGPTTHMLTVAHGFQPTYEAALADLTDAWVEEIGTR
ncbi:hypothetical protein ACFS27_03450 [Promicromonospora vindobonensis]|uniref:Uncharacterized protein n=1 Tax=Promicromonospora vindobonensis TaxID=195748 RepID=A0ABW5VLJ4_9MICO